LSWGIKFRGRGRLDNPMPNEPLFPSRLGAAFGQLHPKLQWVHSGEKRDLPGTVSVERGSSFVARILGLLTSLPPSLKDASIQVLIRIDGDKERWIRIYAHTHRMTSELFREGDALVERVGPAVMTFGIVARDQGMDWQLRKVSMFGVPLRARWFQISARVDIQNSRYHFLIDSALRGVGRIVNYEGLLDVGA
jgi:hypothetical protein